MKPKTVLKESVKSKLLASEELIGRIADQLRMSSQNVRKKINTDAPTLCLPHVLEVIKNVLGIHPGEVIIEIITEEFTHLHE